MNYTFKTYFLMLAHYNQWANQKLFFFYAHRLLTRQLNQDWFILKSLELQIMCW